jgi:uncharacterized membrane protein YraQ (UPF0718 family)
VIQAIKNNKLLSISIVGLLLLFLVNFDKGVSASYGAIVNFKTVGMVLPPIFILIGLMDVWVPKEVMIRYMGKGSGIKGGFLAVVLGAVGAGPLIVAFPVGALLIKKGAKLSNVFLFLGAWTSVKLPIFMFELANFGSKFTLIHVSSNLLIYLIGAIIIEVKLSSEDIAEIRQKANKYA